MSKQDAKLLKVLVRQITKYVNVDRVRAESRLVPFEA
jgi:hypothetical protein